MSAKKLFGFLQKKAKLNLAEIKSELDGMVQKKKALADELEKTKAALSQARIKKLTGAGGETDSAELSSKEAELHGDIAAAEAIICQLTSSLDDEETRRLLEEVGSFEDEKRALLEERQQLIHDLLIVSGQASALKKLLGHEEPIRYPFPMGQKAAQPFSEAREKILQERPNVFLKQREFFAKRKTVLEELSKRSIPEDMEDFWNKHKTRPVNY